MNGSSLAASSVRWPHALPGAAFGGEHSLVVRAGPGALGLSLAEARAADGDLTRVAGHAAERVRDGVIG